MTKKFAKIAGILAVTSILAIGCSSDTDEQKTDSTNDSSTVEADTSKSENKDNNESAEPKRKIPNVGDEAPDIEVTDLETGEKTTLSELRGKRVLLNFFASNCEPCKAEMPDLNELYKNYGEEVSILALSSGEKKEDLESFKSELNLEFPIYLDSEDFKAARDYFVRYVPTTYLIDENGIIKNMVPGMMSYDDMKTLIGVE